MKFGIWIGVALLAFLWLQHARRQRLRDRHAAHRPAPDSPLSDAARAAEPMVACAHCGLYVPLSDASQSSGGRQFCSEAHRRLQSPE